MSIRYPRSTVIAAILLVIVATILAFVIAEVVVPNENTELKRSLENAAVVLIFGAILGGVVKLLLEDLDRGRVRRAEQAQFIVNVLSDLKAVYDRVERARILLAAHRSAKTYGEEMRDLIQSRVQLLNVIRALDNQTAGLKEKDAQTIRQSVQNMSSYLTKLTDEFRDKYKPIADMQRAYEANIDAKLKAQGVDALEVGSEGFTNEAWQAIRVLPEIIDFLGLSNDDLSQPGAPETRYERVFVHALDEASKCLRRELKALLGNAT